VAVSSILCHREAKLARCGVAERFSALKPGLDNGVCQPLSVGATLNRN
jgi:hypothetical protein